MHFQSELEAGAMVDVGEILALFDRGVICLPVRAGSKHPDYRAMGLGFDDVTGGSKAIGKLAFDSLAFCLSQKPPDRETVASWFAGHEGNVGIVAGFNGLVILDIDEARYFERIKAALSRVSSTFPVEKTPHGFHVYLRCREPHPSSSLYLAGRRVGHFSALGGFVTCSPSVLADGSRYRWLPGRSLLDCDPVEIEGLAELGLWPTHPLRRLYERVRPRG
jgi:hypothetical protein